MSVKRLPLTVILAAAVVIAGIAMRVAVDLIEDPDSTPLDVALNLLEEVPTLMIAVGIIAL